MDTQQTRYKFGLKNIPDIFDTLIIKRLFFYFLISTFWIINIQILTTLGIQGTPDSSKLIHGAYEVLSNQLPTHNSIYYASYIALLAVIFKTNFGIYNIVYIQICFSFIAFLALINITNKLAGFWASILAGLMFCTDIWIMTRNSFLMTESLYISTIIILFWLMARFNNYNFLIYSPLVIFGSLLRPTGLTILPIVCTFIVQQRLYPTWEKILWTFSVLCIFIYILGVASTFQNPSDIIKPLEMIQKGVVVGNVDYWKIPMPIDNEKLSESPWETFHYVFRYPLQTSKLILARLIAHFINVRPTYTNQENFLIAAWLLLIYTSAWFTYFQLLKNRITTASLIIVTYHSLIIMTSFASARYLMYTMSIFYIFSATGIGLITRSHRKWGITITIIAVILMLIRIITGPGNFLSTHIHKDSSIIWKMPNTIKLLKALRYNDVVAIGYNTSKINKDNKLLLTVYWLSTKKPKINYSIGVFITNASTNITYLSKCPIGSLFYGLQNFGIQPINDFDILTTSKWTTNMLLSETYPIQLPNAISPKGNIYIIQYPTSDTPPTSTPNLQNTPNNVSIFDIGPISMYK